MHDMGKGATKDLDQCHKNITGTHTSAYFVQKLSTRIVFWNRNSKVKRGAFEGSLTKMLIA